MFQEFDNYTVRLPFVYGKGPTPKITFKEAWNFYWPLGFYLTLVGAGISVLASLVIGWFLLGTGIATAYSLYHGVFVALLVFMKMAKTDN